MASHHAWNLRFGAEPTRTFCELAEPLPEDDTAGLFPTPSGRVGGFMAVRNPRSIDPNQPSYIPVTCEACLRVLTLNQASLDIERASP